MRASAPIIMNCRQRKEKSRKKTALIGILAVLFLSAAVLLPRGSRPDTIDKASENRQGSSGLVDTDPGSIPDYAGEDYIILNGGMPNFNDWDKENIIGEHYSELDELGRCGAAMAMLERSMMPEGKREDIGHIKPSGWEQAKYEGIVHSEPPYLYNRCHLIAYALTGQNANERNLITGTRYMNAETMLPWEEKVMKYLDHSDGHVLYRVTPYFKGRELLARGVEMEAFSVEDNGQRICYHVFVYNVQPGVILDYATGGNRASMTWSISASRSGMAERPMWSTPSAPAMTGAGSGFIWWRLPRPAASGRRLRSWHLI